MIMGGSPAHFFAGVRGDPPLRTVLVRFHFRVVEDADPYKLAVNFVGDDAHIIPLSDVGIGHYTVGIFAENDWGIIVSTHRFAVPPP